MKLILAVCSGLPSVYVLYYSGLLQHLFLFLQSVIVFIYEAVGYFSAIWVSFPLVHIIRGFDISGIRLVIRYQYFFFFYRILHSSWVTKFFRSNWNKNTRQLINIPRHNIQSSPSHTPRPRPGHLLQPGQDWGTPQLGHDWGTPPARTGLGYLLPPTRPGLGYPPHNRDTTEVPPPLQPGQYWGTPLARTGLVYPTAPLTRTGLGHSPTPRQNSSASTCYAEGGMPLAVTQEDFLVKKNEFIPIW